MTATGVPNSTWTDSPRTSGPHDSSPRHSRVTSRRAGRLVLLLTAAAAVRLWFFTGLALGDDVFYVSAAAALAEGQGWPPLPLHWHTRIGITGATAAGLTMAGWSPLVFVWLPFAASLTGVWLCHHIVERVAGERAAWVAAILYAAFPLEIIYSTHLFPDIVAGVLSALAVWLWVRGLRDDSTRALIGSGLALAAGYLCRETVLLLGPVFVALWLFFGRLWRPRLLWVGLAPLVLVFVECAVYAHAVGDPLYRWRALAAQQQDPGNLALIAASASGGSFWSDPLLMLMTSHEFGLVPLCAVVLALLTIRWRPDLRWVALWLLIGCGWLYYGTTVPTAWVPVHRDPRYAAAFTIPAVLLIAVLLDGWPKYWKALATSVLVVVGLAGASLDQGGSELSAHRAFVESGFAGEAALEPFEYYGARWQRGLRSPVAFACASDAGRRSVVDLARTLPGAEVVATSERRYFVFSPARRPDLSARMATAGWRPVTEIAGTAPPARRFLARLLGQVPSQRARAARLEIPPHLVVLEQPIAAGASARD